jgi:hypothetical protein
MTRLGSSASVRVLPVVAVLFPLTVAAGCGRGEQDERPVATPSLSISRPRVPLGSPVDLTYKFVVAQDAPRTPEDLKVMVHFLDADEEQLWTDDHDPVVPTTQWKPGQVIEYSRTVFVPIFPYVGPAAVHVGLYSPREGKRYPLAGETTGQRSYPVGTIELVPRPEDAFIIYKDGWHNAEVSRENATVEWQWTKREATLSFRNPRRDATFFLHLDGRPDLAGEPLDVQVKIGEVVIDQFAIRDRNEVIRRIPVTAAQFGTGDAIDVKLVVSKTFVPSLVPAANSNDARELGVRVFHAYVEPK